MAKTGSRWVEAYILVMKQLLGLQPAGRLVRARVDDLWLVSYPKSGNTWLRFLLGNLISEHPIDFLSIEHVVPDIYVNSLWSLSRKPSPRILKSHECIDISYGRVIYLIRDPRDVAISYWKHQQKMHKLPLDHPLESFVESYLDGSLPYGSWRNHVGGWAGARDGDENFVVLRYEDLLNDTEGELGNLVSRVSDFPTIKTNIQDAVSRSSFHNMRDLEEKQASQWSPTRSSDASIRFVRQGGVGQWRTQMPASLSQAIWESCGDLMHRFGYEP